MPEPSVLFVNPNLMKPAVAPLAIDYLGAAARQSGLEFSLLDLAFEDDRQAAVLRAANEGRYDALAVTVRNTDDCYFASGDFVLESTKGIVADLKDAFGLPVICGGVGFSANPVAALEFLDADYGVVGDGEELLPQIVRQLAAGDEPSRCPGLVLPGDAEGAVPACAILETLDLSPREVIDNGRYFREGGQAGVETKRGCDGTCVYCADPVSKGKRVRTRPPNNVAQEAVSLLRQGVTHWHTCDAEFNRPAEHALGVCQALIEAGLGNSMRWYAYCSPVPFSEELCQSMKRAGCAGINFGVDAGNEVMLRRLGRDHRVGDIEAAVHWCREAEIAVMLDLLLGGPGETPRSVRETIEAMKRIDPDRVGVSLGIRAYAGTPFARWLLGRQGADRAEGVHGDLTDDPGFLYPTFYLTEALGSDPFGLVGEVIGGDPRFFFVAPDAEERDYNYNANDDLVQAIKAGYRGAYWDILRRVQDGLPPE